MTLWEPREVLMYNPETGEEETWSWLRFNQWVEEVGAEIEAEALTKPEILIP